MRHGIWFVGRARLTAAVARAVAPAVPAGRGGPALAGLAGLTWAANVVDAGSTALGVALAGGLVGQGWRLLATATSRLLVLDFGVALALVTAWAPGGRLPAAQRARLAVAAAQPLTVALASTRSPSYSTAA